MLGTQEAFDKNCWMNQWGILMSQCFPMAHLKTPWNREGGRGISRLWPPNIFPNPAPKSRPPAYSHRLYLIRLPRSPLMQGSEETGSAVHWRGGGGGGHMIQLWKSTSCPACSPLSQTQRAPPRMPSSHLPAHHLPPYSRFTSRIPCHHSPWKAFSKISLQGKTTTWA